MMSFVSFTFLFLYLPGLLFFYYLVPKQRLTARNVILLLFSLGFIVFAQPKSLFALAFDAALLYGLGLGMRRAKSLGVRRALLVTGLILTLGMLCAFKYTGFLVENVNALLGASLAAPVLTAPFGVSYFTFLSVGYLVDVYKGACEAEENPLQLALYLTLFPKYSQGPLMRYGDLVGQLTGREQTLDNAAQGVKRLIFGMGKKLLLSNAVAGVAAEIFALSPAALTPAKAWIGAVCYAWQILFDFSGYTDMAIGLGLLFGFRLPENFNHPYMADSITDFWRRWHMSLSRWFRDYVYIPLGGNRRGMPRQIFNLLVVWLLTGLWHGASWNFVLWGLFFAVLLILEKLFLGGFLKKLPRIVRHAYALFFILLGWVIFRSASLSGVGSYLSAMFGATQAKAADGAYALGLLRQYGVEFALAALLSTPLGTRFFTWLEGKTAGRIVELLLLLCIFALSLLALTNTSMNAFIYAQF